MVADGRDRRREGKDTTHRHSSSTREDDDDDDDTGEPEEAPPSKFKLAGDDTGSGIDYNVLDEESWQKLEVYCKKSGIKQAHLESIYSRFARTILRTEHLDFTSKPQFHASLDFLADEFMGTAGEFAGQLFLQTWFLRPKRGIPPPKDRRCVDFARLVIMCCDLARLGDYELLVNLWACVLHRFGHLLPNGTIDLDTQLNTELVHEVITVIHATPDKNVDILVSTLFSEAEEGQAEPGDAKTGGALPGVSGEGGEQGEREKEGEGVIIPGRRYLVLRNILRFCFQHPPLLFPVVQFQRVLRSKIIGSRYWLRRRKPAVKRDVDIGASLGLSDAYHDLFDRIGSRRDAWTIATGQLLLRALKARRTTIPCSERRSVGRGRRARGGRRGRGRGGGGGGGGGGDADGTGGEGGGIDRDGEDREGGVGGAAGGGGGGGEGGIESGGRQRGAGGEGDGGRGEGDCEDLGEKQSRQLLENCLRTPKGYNESREAAPPPTSPGGAAAAAAVAAARAVGVGIPTFTATANRFSVAAKGVVTSRPRVAAVNKNEEVGAGSSSPSKERQQQQQQEARSSTPMTSKKVRSDDGIARSPIPSNKVRGRAVFGNSIAVDDDDDNDIPRKVCAVCLKEFSPSAMCRRCGRLAASAFKDIHGSRRGRMILVPYGHSFGIREKGLLEREENSVRCWERRFDDSTGADFFYNVYYDSSVWKDGIELPEPEPVAKASRRRRKGGSGGRGVEVVINAPSSTPRKKTPSGNPSTRSSRDATSTIAAPPVAALALTLAGDRPRSAANTPSSPQRSAAAARAVLRSRGDDTNSFIPEVVLDAHKRLYPAYRLVLAQTQDAAAVEGRGLRGVTPLTPGTGTGRQGSRPATGQPVSRPASRMGMPLPSVTTT